MTRRRLRPLLIAGALAGALALSACAAPAAPASGGDETDADRSLVVYSGRDAELVDPLIERFEAASGIRVDVRYAGTTELAAQLLEEGEGTPAQVFLSQDAGALGALAEAGMFSELPSDITDRVAAEYSSRDGSWVGLTGRARVIAYDSQTYTADQIPGDVFELLEPQWQGKVGIAPANASFQAFVTALRVTEGEERTRAWLEGLRTGGAQIYSSNGDMLEAVDAGTLPLALLNHYYWARSEQDPQTLRAQLRFGDPGTVSALVNVTGAGILTGAAESAEAREFVEYLVSDEAQTFFVEETSEYPLAGDHEGPAGVPPLADLGAPDLDLADLSSLQETVALLTDVGLL